MFPWSQLLLDSIIVILAFSVFVVGTLVWKPRLWIQDFPADLQAMLGPKTAEEKRLTALIALPFFALFFGLPLLLGWDLKTTMGSDFSFVMAWLYGYGMFFIVNLWDLVVIDWIGTSLVDPQNPPFPGTEGAAGYRDYAFHFRGFLKGCAMGIVFATVFALVLA